MNAPGPMSNEVLWCSSLERSEPPVEAEMRVKVGWGVAVGELVAVQVAVGVRV